jgi:xanthine dehydrogenase YagS FAD-binding subunit
MKTFSYDRAANLNDALSRLEADDQMPVMLAGGTDLLTLMKADITSPTALIDIKRIDDLAGDISFGDQETTIGALTTLAAIQRNQEIRARHKALSDAAGLAASPQIRNRATIGGNLLQRPRCWYYRSPHLTCWLKGGDTCYAREGENALHALFDVSPCVAVHPSDPAAALIALNAEVTLRSSAGERRVAVEQLFAPPEQERRTEHLLARDDIIQAIHLPATQTQSVYLKAMDRKVWAFAVVGVAASLYMKEGVIDSARLVLSGVAPVPWRARSAEALLNGQLPSDQLFTAVAAEALSGAAPLAQNGYKIPLANTLITRALHACAETTA